MKQPFFLFYFLLCWNINLLAQEKNIDGSYYDEVGFEIKITDNHFYYIDTHYLVRDAFHRDSVCGGQDHGGIQDPDGRQGVL